MRRSFGKYTLPRKSRRHYWLNATHPDIGWHSWQCGEMIEGGTFIRTHFNKRPGTTSGFTGWDMDKRRFVVESVQQRRIFLTRLHGRLTRQKLQRAKQQ